MNERKNECKRNLRKKTKVKVKFFIKIVPVFLHAILATMRIPIPVVFSYLPPSPYFLGAFAKLRKATIGFVMYVRLSVRPSIEQLGSPGRILMKFDIWTFFENLSRKSSCILTRITGTLYEAQYIFLIICRWVLLRMRTISNKWCRENQTRILCSVFFFFSENRAVYEIMWKNILEPGRPQMTIWRMLNASWITKATNPYSEYVICIAFPLQK
jgi:hypothetical protein